jgi:hypothetical protein
MSLHTTLYTTSGPVQNTTELHGFISAYKINNYISIRSDYNLQSLITFLYNIKMDYVTPIKIFRFIQTKKQFTISIIGVFAIRNLKKQLLSSVLSFPHHVYLL